MSGGLIASVPSTSVSTPSNPTGTASLTLVHAGLAIAFTPSKTGRVCIVITGQFANSTATDGMEVNGRYGTGAAPANGAAVTGSGSGLATRGGTSDANNSLVPFNVVFWVTLTVGTAYWIDAVFNAVTGGTATLSQLSVSITEF